jgi:hypothetical protein
MLNIELIVTIFAIVLGIPNRIIDIKHRKRKAYEPGHAWGYYSKLNKGGSWEGKFMMWSGYSGIVLVLVIIADTFYSLAN